MDDASAVKRIVNEASFPPARAKTDAAAAELRPLGDAALAPLTEIASQSPRRPTNRQIVAFVLIGRLGTPAARDWLLSATAAKEVPMRQNAVVGLGERGNPDVYPRLRELQQSDPDLKIRQAAIVAMGGVKATAAVDLLTGLLDDGDAGTRMAAAMALGDIGDARATDALRRSALSDQQERVRVEAAGALRKLGAEPPALPALDPASAPLSPSASKPLDPDHPPAKDPRGLGVLTARSAATRDERVVDYCPACRMRTVQDRYTVIAGRWFGFKLPFSRPSARGKLGTKAAFSACAECSTLIPLDDAARAFVAQYDEPYLRPGGWRGDAID